MYTLQSFVFKNDIIELEIEINGLDRMKFNFLLWLKVVESETVFFYWNY